MKYLLRIRPTNMLFINGELYQVVDSDLSPRGKLTLLLKSKTGKQVSIGTEVGFAITTDESLEKVADFIQQG